jgi:hypothetical protein
MKSDRFIYPQDFRSNSFDLEKTSEKIMLSGVFASRQGCYLNELYLFMAHFNTIPNLIIEINIGCSKANIWFTEKYKPEIKDCYYDKIYSIHSKSVEFDDIFYFLFEDLIVNFDTSRSIVRFLFRNTPYDKVENMIIDIRKFRSKKSMEKPEICLLVNTHKGIETKSFDLPRPKLSIEDNYNDDFPEIHRIILKRLSKKNDKGLVLLHGKPGTGKTSYIRYLISMVKKNVIFLPPDMASAITSPNLISILIDNPNSVFVIEDAENIIIDREKEVRSPVSALLNISDGLLSDCLNIQIICSFNTDISKIDNALMRKGRLIAKYEFTELEVQKANALSRKLGFKNDFDSPMTLTEIYNQDEKEFQQRKRSRPMGFITDGKIKN